MNKIDEYRELKFFNHLTDVVYGLDEKLSICYGNNEFFKAYPIKKSKLFQTTLSDIYDNNKWIDEIKKYIKSKSDELKELYRTKDQINIKVTIQAWNAGSKIIYLITEKHINEESFNIQQAFEKPFGNIFNYMKESMAVFKVIKNEKNHPIDFEFITVNKAYEKSIGYKLADLVGKMLFDIFPNIDLHWTEIYKNAYLFQHTFSLTDYSVETNKYWEIKAFPAGKNNIVSVAKDITTQKFAEKEIKDKNEKLKKKKEKHFAYNEQLRFTCEKIKESEMGYQTLFQHSTNAVLIILNDKIIDCNKNTLTLFNTNTDNLIGKNIDVISSSSINQNLLLSTEINKLEPLDEITFDYAFITNNQSVIQTRTTLSCHQISDKYYYYLIINDLTKEKAYLKTIKENQFHLMQAQQSAKLGYWSFKVDDPDSSIFWSDQMYSILETSSPVNLNDFIKKYIHPTDIDEVSIQLRNNESNIDFDYQFKIVTSSGNVKHVRKKAQIVTEHDQQFCRGILQDISELKQKEEQIQNNEFRFQTVLQNMPVLLFAVNRKDTIIFWNKECERVTEYTSEEIIGSSDMPNKIFKAVDFKYLNLKSDSELYRNFETEITCKDQSKSTILWSGLSKLYPIQGWHNWIVGIDITQRNLNEQEIISQKEFLDTLIDSLPLMVFAKEPPDFKYTLVNKQFKDYINKPMNEIINHTDFDFHKDSAQEKRDLDEEVIKSNQSVRKVISSYDGSQLFDIIKVPVNKGSNQKFLLGIAQDITANYEQQKRIIFESKVHESLSNASIELISQSLSIDKIIKIIFKTCSELTNCESGYIAYIQPENDNVLVHSFFKKDGQSDALSSNFFFKNKADFHKNGIFGITLNNEFSEYNNNLEANPSQQNGSLLPNKITNYLTCPTLVNQNLMGQIVLVNSPKGFSNDHVKAIKSLSNVYGLAIFRKQMEWDLIYAKEKAEESDRLKSAFLANMSHEIRTPMNAIIGFSQLLANDSMPSEKRAEFTQLINNSCNDLLLIVSDIIDISKIEAGQLDLKKSTFDLHLLLEECLNLSIHKLKQRHKNLTILLDNPLLNAFEILADKTRLKQVLLNLIDNAIKFTKSGVVNFGYEITKETKLRFYVSDTGIGILTKDQNDIFESFRQTEETIKRTYGGTGLGLAISKSIVEQMHGTIGLNSKINEGSTFWFEIPINSSYKNFKAIENKQKINLDKQKVLIIDNKPITSNKLAYFLKPSKPEIHFAYNEKEALSQSVNLMPELIILNLQLQKQVDYEFIKNIKTSNTKQVILYFSDNNLDFTSIKKALPLQIIKEPMTQEELLIQIKDI